MISPSLTPPLSPEGRGRLAGRCALVAGLLLVCGCGATPRDRVERALYLDLERVVAAREQSEWTIDRLDVESVAATAMRSTCQTSAAHRERLERWLDARILAEGGPAREAWLRAGRDEDAIEDLLRLERIRAVLRYAHDHADADCPFWLEPDEDFRGLHQNTERLVVLLESAGGAQMVVRSGEAAFGGTGGGRVMPGWGLSSTLTLATGLEIAGAGAFPRNDDGTRSLEASISAAIPVLLRYSRSTQMLDVEVAFTTRSPLDDILDLRPGFRLLAGFGFSTLHIGAFTPGAVLFVGYEMLPAFQGEPTAHVIRAGTRFGLTWDP
ncbi:MAG: hypothetical protein IT379_32210 [Deltaproteobacteria bacterium]|nr:hypothetical protein [Deltaproteobacteria bacterium]